MPQDACHAKSSINRLQLNNRIALANIADSKRHDADDSNIVQGFALDRLSVHGDERTAQQLPAQKPLFGCIYKILEIQFTSASPYICNS